MRPAQRVCSQLYFSSIIHAPLLPKQQRWYPAPIPGSMSDDLPAKLHGALPLVRLPFSLRNVSACRIPIALHRRT